MVADECVVSGLGMAALRLLGSVEDSAGGAPGMGASSPSGIGGWELALFICDIYKRSVVESLQHVYIKNRPALPEVLHDLQGPSNSSQKKTRATSKEH